MKLLVTGGAGFIGSNFIRHLLTAQSGTEIVNFDKLTYAGNPESLSDFADDPRYSFVRGDIADPEQVASIFAAGFDGVVNFAAETHVDRSIENASPFLHTNVAGVMCLLEAARKFRLPRFVHISTDEVYGSAPAGVSFSEQALLDPRSPYAASKASADHFVAAYANTYGVSAIILRCTNNYGPFQFPEKLIPLMVANAQDDKSLPIYGDGLQERDWLFVEDYCRAIAVALAKGRPGEVYNVSAGRPLPNLQVVRTILKHLSKPESLMKYVTDRPGHDRRYAMDASKIEQDLGWKPKETLESGLRKTVRWYLENHDWVADVTSGTYRQWIATHYSV